MNYIGSKYSLVDFIKSNIQKTLESNKDERNQSQMIFADLLAGTGAISTEFKREGYSVIANDIQYYSYVLLRHLVGNNHLDKEICDNLIQRLNNLQPIEGFIYKNYSFEGTEGQEFRRMYFSEYNAKKCDAVRIELEKMRENQEVSDDEYFYLLGSLINSVDKYANTASVYGAFLKKLKKSALKEMQITGLPIIDGEVNNFVYNEDILQLIEKISGDILYLDPPYNSRQYCTNYHLLETIAKYDNPQIKGKTGLRDYVDQKSPFCSAAQVEPFFAEIIKKAKFKYIFLSYNNEGLMSFDTIEKIMKKYGKYKVYMKEYHRFKADNARDSKADNTIEYLHCLIKK